jgi:hypothetical protein
MVLLQADGYCAVLLEFINHTVQWDCNLYSLLRLSLSLTHKNTQTHARMYIVYYVYVTSQITDDESYCLVRRPAMQTNIQHISVYIYIYIYIYRLMQNVGRFHPFIGHKSP